MFEKITRNNLVENIEGDLSNDICLLGLDEENYVMILQNEPNIREVIPFAKTGEGRDPMMESPAEIEPGQLHELGLLIKKSV
jgi:aspartyl-tRNA synthetase